jgi:hypothetical protein
MNLPPTTISGYVFAPNGSLPLYGVNVYIPNGDPGPFTPGLDGTCNRCVDVLPGVPILKTQTDETGHFTLINTPVGMNVPLVIVSGKWRRQLLIPMVSACQSYMLSVADGTFPKDRDDLSPLSTSVDMPQIAISTGSWDALECLILKLGISPKEITTDRDVPRGRINLFADTTVAGEGADSFDAAFTAMGGGSGDFSDSERALWGAGGTTSATAAMDSFNVLKQYDIVILSCEGGQYPESKAQADLDAMKLYADYGGRLFLSHWHNIWIEGSVNGAHQQPAVWPTVASFNNQENILANGAVDTINEIANPKGASFATWMLGVGGSTVNGTPTRDAVPIVDGSGRNTVTALNASLAEDWVDLGPPPAAGEPQIFQFTTPLEAPVATRCGRVVLSDMHVSGDSASAPGDPYPTACSYQPPAPISSATLTPQEKALAFMFFDISSCVGPTIP